MSTYDAKFVSTANYLARHYSYECKATAQERPYISRPSRTQQLANPKLVPKLNSDIPNDLLRKFVKQRRTAIAKADSPQNRHCR